MTQNNVQELDIADFLLIDEVLLHESIISYSKTGSRYICNPPVLNTDQDWILLCNNWSKFFNFADQIGYVLGGSSIGPIKAPEKYSKLSMQSSNYYFISLKKGDVNLIVTESREFFNRFEAATHVAKRLNLLNKNDRIALFEAVLHGYKWSENEPKFATLNQNLNLGF